MDYKKILDKVKRELKKSYVAGGDSSDDGNDWLVFIKYVIGRETGLGPWEFFEPYIDGLIEKQIENLSVEDKCSLWQIAVEDDFNAKDYLEELEIEEGSETYYKMYDKDKILEFLSNKLRELADDESYLIEEDEQDDDDEDDEDPIEDEEQYEEEAESDNYVGQGKDENGNYEKDDENLRSILNQMQKSIDTVITYSDDELLYFAKKMDGYLKKVFKLLG